MSIRDLFDGETPYKIFSETPENIRRDAESLDNVTETWKNKTRFIPKIDFSDPENFVKYGSAEKYYEDAITRIYEDYPYDGSSKEKQEFANKSTYVDLWMFDNKYPRTNGYITLSADGWGSPTTGPSAGTDYYGNPSIKEYIALVGGPHTASEGMIGKRLSSTFDDSNKYETNIYDDAGFIGTGTRENNLKSNFDNGVTIEFWLKKPGYDITKTQKEVIFDLWNDTTGSASSYGRITLQVNAFNLSGAAPPFQLTIRSGSSGPIEQQFGATVTSTSIADWNQYAFRMYNSDGALKTDFYINGNLLETSGSSPILGEITGSLLAQVGALRAPTSDGTTEYAGRGWGKLSGSLDEFRFWKSKRTSQEIGRDWFTQVYGGSNTDISNADLGVYYKFNEGITGFSSIDSSILDYSGRITNGTWLGYTSNSRATASAMILAGAATTEFQDPIIYPQHPLVESTLTEMRLSGSYYDHNNTTSLYNSYPNWIIDEEQSSGNQLGKLTQVMSSYFDNVYLQIEELNKIKNIDYTNYKNREIPFAGELLEGVGFVAPEIFADASLLNQIFNRDEEKNFEEDVFEIKNIIYRNIYNNINTIYKSKGTDKSFRNLIRCYGVDEDLIKVNAYANNLVYTLRENYDFASTKKKFVDFYNPDTFNSTIYQQTASGNPDSVSFISASQGTNEVYTSFTCEAEVIFPKKKNIINNVYYPTNFVTSSIFGFHTADPAAPTDFTWPANDYDIQIYSVMPPENGNKTDGYFLLTSSYYGIEEKTPIIKDLYNNGKWNFAINLFPEKVDADLVSGSTDTNYSIELYAVNGISDIVQNEITITSSILADGEKLLTEPKRIYAGAHRQNFTGSTLQKSDIKLSSVKYWMNHLDNSVIKSHARDSDNYGSKSPLKNVYNYVTSIGNVEIPQMETLALYWRFDQVTSSDNGGGVSTVPDAGFNVADFSSGSSEIRQRYDWLGNVLGSQHTGRADFFYPNETSVINVEFLPSARQTTPEIINSQDTIKIFNIEDDQIFTKQTRPSNFYFMVEKSMYRAITQEVVNYFSTILEFNHLIGDPVNRYRQEYKPLQKLRNLFFEKVENQPDIERYIEYYKWIDDSLSQMIEKLFPASVVKQDGIRTVIESHILERNKYWNKYPTVDLKQEDPEAGIRGINELTYSWDAGHHPVDDSQDKSCFWWKNRAERDKSPLATGISGVDLSKQQILSVTLSALNRSYSNPLKYSVKRSQIISSGLTSDNNKRQIVKQSVKFGDSNGIVAKTSDIKDFESCSDDSALEIKKRFAFKAENEIDPDTYLDGKGDLLLPFVAVSSSVTAGYQSLINTGLKAGFGINNLHVDSYINSEVPMQGPFTEKYVGGNQNRHIDLNDGTDTALNRPEAWSLDFQTLPKAIKFVHQPVNSPRAMLYRDMVAKRSINIKNIKTNTSSYGLGNYERDYQIVQTVGRTTNNVAFVKAGGFIIEEIPSPYIAGMDDYAKPQRGKTGWVFVNRFSSPGAPETAGDSNGGPYLDPEAAEYSQYNNLNYRNTTVRNPYRLLLTSHVNQFGYYSDTFGIGNGPSVVNSLNYAGTASIYQVNRNPIKQMKDSGSTTVTASVYDNYFVQHPIPRTDLQYSWITASAISYDTFGYLPYDGEGDLVTFSSASEFASFGNPLSFGADNPAAELIPTTYNWMNLNSREPLEYINSFIGFREPSSVESYLNDPLIIGGLTGDGKTALLNSILLKRNGPYQHPSWKQTRGYENPLVKKWNGYNITAYNLENDDFKLREDPPVISKYKSLAYQITIATSPDTLKNISINCSYGNEKTLFANRMISSDLNITNENLPNSYDKIKNLYNFKDVNNPVSGIGYLQYSEQVYPSAINMYSERNRSRANYQNDFWRNNRIDRTILGKTKFGGSNSQGYVVSQSAWGLDTSEQFGTGLSTYIAQSASIGAAGELQNDYTFAWSLVGSSLGSTSELRSAPAYFRKHTMGSVFSVIDPKCIYQWHTTGSPRRSILATGSYLLADEELDGSAINIQTPWPTLSSFNNLGHVSIFGGNAKFEVHEQAGSIKDNIFIPSPATPFYDKYEQYNYNMRLKNKDMSLIPEYKSSNHIKKYLGDSAGFLSINTASFSIFGITSNNTETVTYTRDGGNHDTYDIQASETTPQNSSEDDFYRIYSYSDFMENFEIINEDQTELDLNKSLSLTCKALMKFLPYDGFYPAERTLQIAQLFTEEYDKNILGKTDISPPLINFSAKNRPVSATLFSPGILYNTIKSGIAVDYPIYTGSFETVQYFNDSGTATPPNPEDYSDYYAIGRKIDGGGTPTGQTTWDLRVPFETILEPERIKNINIRDMEPHPSASLSTAIRGNTAFSVLNDPPPFSGSPYKLAMRNFLGATTKFFMKDSSLTSLVSNQEHRFLGVTGSQTYGMRIKMRRSMQGPKESLEGYPVPQEYFTNLDASFIENNDSGSYRMATLNMYSRPSAFGPPVAGTGSFNGTGFLNREPDEVFIDTVPNPPEFQDATLYDSLYGYNPSFTPPYYNGEAWLDILYTPETNLAPGKVTLEEIFGASELISWRIDSTGKWPSGTDNTFLAHKDNVNSNAMQITSSVNVLAKDFLPSVTNKAEKNQSWIIQTKFETPVLNFGPFGRANYSGLSSSYLEGITLPDGSGDPWDGYGGKTTTPIGMWHQFGTIPNSNQGIFLEIEDINKEWLLGRAPQPDTTAQYNGGEVRSLADIVGFEQQSKRIGELANSKTVYEAIVAVPFVVIPTLTANKVTDPNRSQRLFFDLPSNNTYKTEWEGVSIEDRKIKAPFLDGDNNLLVSGSVISMAEKIKDRYVFPPEFDFYRNTSIKPMAMYIFEFEHTFDRDDLSHIWQNVSPKFGQQFKQSSATINHPLLTGNILDDLKDEVQWMVFKVKQRAESNYFNLIAGSNKKGEELFSYNWPYDYFSMVEFAKIDSSIQYGKIKTVKISETSSATGIAKNTNLDLESTNSSTASEDKAKELRTAGIIEASIEKAKRGIK